MRVISSLSELKEVIVANPGCIVTFGAPWCAPCKMLKPILERIAKKRGVELIEIDAQVSPEIAQEYNITGLPTTISFGVNGMKTVVGARSSSSMEKAL